MKIMKPIKNCFKEGGEGKRKNNRGDKFDQSMTYANMDISQ
jgi:hypothetical protein